VGSYQAARRRVARSGEHRQSKYLNNLTPARAAVSVRVQWDITALPAPSSPAPYRGIPQRDGQPLQYLE
jgi:transposase-like protein